jgi:flavin-dependent trigonelline monooxygenase, reductase component
VGDASKSHTVRDLSYPRLVDAEHASGRELRDAFGTFLTGVTIVTTWEDGRPRGFTANSFTSVSLDPPLVLICIARQASSCEAFLRAPRFGINILSDCQQDLSARFASPGLGRFDGLQLWQPPGGPPLLADCVTALDCERHEIVVAGDHVVLIGRVKAFSSAPGRPLGYYRGTYVSFGIGLTALEEKSSGAMAVATLIDADGSVLLWQRPQRGFWELPSLPLHYGDNHRRRLPELLRHIGVEADVSFLYSVYQEDDPYTTLVFRGPAVGPVSMRTLPDGTLVKPFAEEDEPWRLVSGSSPAEVLKRYFRERAEARFGIYWDVPGEGGRIAALAGPPRQWTTAGPSPPHPSDNER